MKEIDDKIADAKDNGSGRDDGPLFVMASYDTGACCDLDEETLDERSVRGQIGDTWESRRRSD